MEEFKSGFVTICGRTNVFADCFYRYTRDT